MTALVALLRTILGDQFPTGLLVVVGIVLIVWPGHGLEHWTGIAVLGFAISWSYWATIVQAYGSRDGRPVTTATRLIILLVSWLGVCGVLYLLYA